MSAPPLPFHRFIAIFATLEHSHPCRLQPSRHRDSVVSFLHAHHRKTDRPGNPRQPGPSHGRRSLQLEGSASCAWASVPSSASTWKGRSDGTPRRRSRPLRRTGVSAGGRKYPWADPGGCWWELESTTQCEASMKRCSRSDGTPEQISARASQRGSWLPPSPSPARLPWPRAFRSIMRILPAPARAFTGRASRA